MLSDFSDTRTLLNIVFFVGLLTGTAGILLGLYTFSNGLVLSGATTIITGALTAVVTMAVARVGVAITVIADNTGKMAQAATAQPNSARPSYDYSEKPLHTTQPSSQSDPQSSKPIFVKRYMGHDIWRHADGIRIDGIDRVFKSLLTAEAHIGEVRDR